MHKTSSGGLRNAANNYMLRISPNSSMVFDILHKNDMLTGELTRLDALLLCKPGEEHCERCDQVPVCKKRLDTFFEDMLGLMQTHFGDEERAMRLIESCLDQRNIFEDHMEAHGDLMQRLTELASEGRKPSGERMVLRELLNKWLRHFSTEDERLLVALQKL